MAKQDDSRSSYAVNLAIRGLLRVALAMPYHYRIPFFGWVTSRIISPVAGYKKRIHDNLDDIFPDMPRDERRRITNGVPDNTGRTLIEIYSVHEFIGRIKDLPLTGPGAAALEQAHADNRPVILATGHVGNYDVARGALIAKGYRVGGLYNPMRNVYFNSHYVEAINTVGQPMFERGRRGFGKLLLEFIK